MQGSYLGPEYAQENIGKELKIRLILMFALMMKLLKYTAHFLNDGKVDGFKVEWNLNLWSSVDVRF